MKFLCPRAILVSLFLAVSLESQAEPEEFLPGEVVEKVVSLKSPDQQYALYLPPDYDPARQWPVLFVLDPRGRAAHALGLFRDGAEEHGWIILSSYQSRSDTVAMATVQALDALLYDAEVRFRPNTKRYYLAGLSGTSHLAWNFANHLADHVAGVIGCGGGLSREVKEPDDEVGFAYFGLVGTVDFNYQEMRRLDAQLAERQADHRLVVYEGGHGWPPDKAWTRLGIDWLELMAMKRGLTPRLEPWIEARWKAASAAVDEAVDPVVAVQRLDQLVRDFDGLRDVESLSSRLDAAKRSPEVVRWYKKEKKLASQERSYIRDRLEVWVGRFWSDEDVSLTLPSSLVDLRIKTLRKKAADEKDRQSANSAQRLLETVYTQTSFYMARRARESGDIRRGELVLSLAEVIFPRRLWAYWARASLYAENGGLNRAFKALDQAIAVGGADLSRLEHDSTWDRLRGDPRWARLLESLREPASQD